MFTSTLLPADDVSRSACYYCGLLSAPHTTGSISQIICSDQPWIGNIHGQIEPKICSTTLERERANHSIASATSDRCLTAVWLCSCLTHAIFPDFRYFHAGSVDFELVVVKRCVWGTFKSDAHHLARRFTFFTFPKSNAEKCDVMLWAKLFGHPHFPMNPPTV